MHEWNDAKGKFKIQALKYQNINRNVFSLIYIKEKYIIIKYH